VHSFDVAAGPASGAPEPAQQEQQQQDEEDLQQPAQAADHVSTQKQSKFDSLDYELVENTVYRTDAAGRTHLDHIMEGAVKWTICIILGEDSNAVRLQFEL
jgi:hypothetical protein